MQEGFLIESVLTDNADGSVIIIVVSLEQEFLSFTVTL